MDACENLTVESLNQKTVEQFVSQTWQQCRAEGVTHFTEVDEHRLYPIWRGLLENGDGLGYALVNDAGQAVGFLLGLVTHDWLTDERQALEYLWLVAPSARKAGAAVRLLDAFESAAKSRGCARIICGADARHAPAVMERFYKRRGYEPRVATYSKLLE